MPVLENLEPKNVFRFFEEISSIPRGSGHTEKISAYLAAFAEKRGLAFYQDHLHNIIIFKEASIGYEKAEPVILQGHMDMVCEKEPGCPKDMEKEGLDLAVDTDVIYAKGTTLGGDDGIAIAMMLALLEDDSLPHPRLEAVMTVDEETGMTGAMGLDVSALKGRRMLNIDSEDEGIFTVSCAGGNVSRCALPVNREAFSGMGYEIEIKGLTGGHSGTEIAGGHANAIMVLGWLLYGISQKTEMRIVSLEGGSKNNAIPVAARAEIAVQNLEETLPLLQEAARRIHEAYARTEKKMEVCICRHVSGIPMDGASTKRVLTMLTSLPNGVQKMSEEMEGLVETSLNAGILKSTETAVSLSFCVRSSVESEKQLLTGRLVSIMEKLGGSVTISGDYPGWQYRKHSPLRELMTEVFAEQYGYMPKIEAIHAGVECGLFAGKIPELDCISFGPDLTDIHTPREKMHIASVQRTWKMLCEVLRRM